MTEADWLACGDPIRLLEQTKLESRRKARLLAWAGCRRAWSEVRDERCRDELRAAEKFADGAATSAALETASWEAVLAYEEAQGSVRSEVLALYAAISLTAGDVTVSDLVAIFQTTADLAPFGQNVRAIQADLIRDIFGNPFRSITLKLAWRSLDVISVAKGINASQDFSGMPVLADALQEAGCDSDDILNHLRDTNATHVRGCWASIWCWVRNDAAASRFRTNACTDSHTPLI